MNRLALLLILLTALAIAGCSKDRTFWNDGGQVGDSGRKIWDTNGQMQSDEERKIWDSNGKVKNDRKIWENKEGEPVVD